MSRILKIVGLTIAATIVVFVLGQVLVVGALYYISDLDNPAPAVLAPSNFGHTL